MRDDRRRVELGENVNFDYFRVDEVVSQGNIDEAIFADEGTAGLARSLLIVKQWHSPPPSERDA
jgi:hypothetical protein